MDLGFSEPQNEKEKHVFYIIQLFMDKMFAFDCWGLSA